MEDFKLFRISTCKKERNNKPSDSTVSDTIFCAYCGNKYLFDYNTSKCKNCGNKNNVVKNVEKPAPAFNIFKKNKLKKYKETSELHDDNRQPSKENTTEEDCKCIII
jgi:hypothetical protein